MKLLVIEDEKELSGSICTYLKRDNFLCDPVFNFDEAMERVKTREYDCILLDISLPKINGQTGNGLNILSVLKQMGKADGVVIISAKDSLDDKLKGLHLGADDYLTKPFHLPELSARVAAIIRRKCFDGNNKLETDDLVIDLSDKTVKGRNGTIELTRKEYELLVYFVSNKNKVVTKEAIVEHLWGDQIDMNDNHDFIYTHLRNLRKKLMQGGCANNISVIYGMGYKFNVGRNEKKK